jgi:hypothetical protein
VVAPLWVVEDEDVEKEENVEEEWDVDVLFEDWLEDIVVVVWVGVTWRLGFYVGI